MESAYLLIDFMKPTFLSSAGGISVNNFDGDLCKLNFSCEAYHVSVVFRTSSIITCNYYSDYVL